MAALAAARMSPLAISNSSGRYNSEFVLYILPRTISNLYSVIGFFFFFGKLIN